MPHDLNKLNEDPIYATLEDCTQELMFEDKLVRNSFLNSLTAFDYLTRTQICPVNQNFSSLADISSPDHTLEEYKPY